MSVDLADVEALIALSETGSLSGAASRLGVSRATVRRRIQGLERGLGVSLTSSSESRVELTEAGLVCVDEGRHLVRQRDDLAALVRVAGSQPSGRLRVAIPIGAAGPELTLSLRHFGSAFPGMKFELRFTENPVGALLDGSDVAMVFGTLPNGDWKVSSIGRAELGAYAHPDYLAQAPPLRTVEDLKHHRVMHSTSLPVPKEAWPQPEGGAVPIDPWLTTSDGDVVRQAVVAGFGVGLVLTDAVEPHIVRVLPNAIGTVISVWALTTPTGSKLPRVREFIRSSREYMES